IDVIDRKVDLNGFGLISRNLAQGNGFTLGFGPTIRRAPLYPFFGAVLLWLTGYHTVSAADAVAYRPILIGNCLLCGATCFAVWRLARRLFGPRVGIFAAVLCALLPQSLRYVGMTEVEALMGLLIVVLASASLTLVDRPSATSGAYLGLSAAAATL